MPTVKTYIHVSDLHFAGTMQRALYDPWARHVPILDGLVGHDPKALRYLHSTFQSLRRTEPQLDLIVTGDLTAQSIVAEFDLAETFLKSRTNTIPFLGLGVPDWIKFSIPGNHDQWPGYRFCIWGPCNARVRRMFPNDAFVIDSFELKPGLPLVFLGLNSDADVGPYSSDRILARGSFVTAIGKLRQLIDDRDPSEIRILLLHHSLEYDGGKYASMGRTPLIIDDASRAELLQLLEDYDVRVVLTGHAHEPFHTGVLPNIAGKAGVGVLESRCGTTSQRLRGSLNSLFVHRIEGDNQTGSFEWRSSLYVHTGMDGPLFTERRPTLNGRVSEASIRIYP